MLDRTFWAVFLSIAIIGTITWLAIVEYNHHPRIYRHSQDATILQVGDSELDFNHPEGSFSIWWEGGGRNVRIWRGRKESLGWRTAVPPLVRF